MANINSTSDTLKRKKDHDEKCWQQLGDGSADGSFIYAVITTGIYCRPSCPSRRPRRDNVRFFNNAADAETAGFRACKRCHPLAASADAPQIARIARLCRYIETAEQEPSLEQLASYAGISAYHLQRQFKVITGVSPKAYAKAHRQKLDASMDPKKSRAAPINFACGDSSLGKFLVARSKKGLCAILLGDSEQELIADLRARFPAIELHHSETNFSEQLQRVVRLIEYPRQALDLPLDIRGTLFQQKVWQSLREIPTGETRSYSDIAQAIGSPKSVRAVASACAANALAIAIPCHRVVRTDGNLSGYRWGVERKKILLQREAGSGETQAELGKTQTEFG